MLHNLGSHRVLIVAVVISDVTMHTGLHARGVDGRTALARLTAWSRA